ncbi:hypothetical protein KC19_11G138100 [Ceratodon purpureus]|uniref:Cytochrome P450 n=1 Tax=Ceratodon purpureus TaxID=3225 RepID=A0A8T0GG65_CERPU|nr:hypothetical protein KC19_11G138100 [Ceratodon purpureus]
MVVVASSGWGLERIIDHVGLITVLAGIVVGYFVWAAVDQWVLHRGRKGPVHWPILGATVEVLRNYDHLNDWCVPYFLRDGLTFPCGLADVKYTFTADPANVEHILKTSFDNYPKGELFHKTFEIFFGDGIFNVDGELWKRQRRLASHEFSSTKLRDFSSVVYRDYSLRMASILSDASATQRVLDMQDLFLRFTMDSIFKVTFGYEIGTLKPELPDIPFADAFALTNEIASSRFMNPFWKLQRVLNVGSEATIAKSAKVVDDFIYDVMKARNAENLQNSGQRDLFTRFKLLNEGGKELTDKTLRDTLLNFLIAGRDSSGLTMSWFIYMMTLHPHIEQKLFEELRDLDTENVVNGDMSSKELPQTGGDDYFHERVERFSELLTFDALLNLQYLHACILETLRLYPVVPLNPKSVAADDTLPDGTEVKKGEFVMYAAYAMGRMPSLWGPDATEFKPERWLVDGGVQPESPFKFVTFQVIKHIQDSSHSFFEFFLGYLL